MLQWTHKSSVELDSEDGEEAHDNNEKNDEQEPPRLTPREGLNMLDRLVHTSGISEDDQNVLVSMIKKIEKIVINQNKERNIRNHFA